MKLDLNASYKTDQVCEMLHMSKPTILAKIKTGEIKIAGRHGKGYIIKGSDLYQFITNKGLTVELSSCKELMELRLQELSILIDIARAKYEIEQSPQNLLAWKKAELNLVQYKIKLCEGGEA